MFEKFSNFDVDSAGSGGEYTVQAGFGWTNGVVLWVASTYGGLLEAPKCPNITVDSVSNENSSGSKNGAVPGVGVGPVTVVVSAVLAIVVSGVML